MQSSRWYTPVNYHQTRLKDTNRHTLTISNCPIDAVNPAVASSQSPKPRLPPTDTFHHTVSFKSSSDLSELTWFNVNIHYLLECRWMYNPFKPSAFFQVNWPILENKASQMRFSLFLIHRYFKIKLWVDCWIACWNYKWWDKTPISAEQADVKSYSLLNRVHFWHRIKHKMLWLKLSHVSFVAFKLLLVNKAQTTGVHTPTMSK